STVTLARICRTSSYGASGRTSLEAAAIVTSGKLTVASRPRNDSNALIVEMSRNRGTLRNLDSPSESKLAHKMGSAAFFAPPTGIVPRNGRPPTTRIASMGAKYAEHAERGKKPKALFQTSRTRNRDRLGE